MSLCVWGPVSAFLIFVFCWFGCQILSKGLVFIWYISQHVNMCFKSKQNASDKKSNFTIKAKSIPVTPKIVASSQGAMREKWLVSIYKEIENFLQNMAIQDADPSLVVKWKSLGKWPLPCQMVFVLKPLTQTQQTEDDVHQDYKHKSRLVICGNFAAWGEHSTTTTNLDAPLLRLMLSLTCSSDTTWSSIDITSAFLNADIHVDDTALVTPPPIRSCQDGNRETEHCLASEESYLWTSEKPRVYGKKRETRSFANSNSSTMISLPTLFKESHIHPSLWFIAEGPVAEHQWIPPFDHSLRSDECTARLHEQQILGYVGVYVDDLLIAGPRSLNDALITAVQVYGRLANQNI